MKKPVQDTNQTMQRVKVGLSGLAAVVLLIGLASAIFSAARRADQTAMIAADPLGNVSGNAMLAADTNEPLAELGVTPAIASNATVVAPAR